MQLSISGPARKVSYTGGLWGFVASLISIIYLMSVPSQSILTVTMKYTAGYKATNQWGKIHSLLVQLNKKVFFFAFALLFVFLLSSRIIANFLNISSLTPLFILAAALLFAFAVPINRGIMQGLENFGQLSSNCFP